MVGPTESNAVTWDGGGPKNGNRGEKTPTQKSGRSNEKQEQRAKRKEKSRLVSFSFFFWGSLKVSKCALL